MNEKSRQFIASPAILKEQDAEARISNPESISVRSDFGSYARANRGRGLTDSGIEHHNLITATNRACIYRDAIGSMEVRTIADLGCGLGFTSSALAEVFVNSSVTGYEISQDACEFARRNWPDLRFIQGAVSPNASLGDRYDLVIAQEFYPFTRTDDPDIHAQFIHTIAESLTDQGIALITLTEGSPESVLDNAVYLARILAPVGIAVSVFSLPFDRVYAKLPIYSLAKLASCFLGFLLKKPRFMALSISRRH